jgi:chromosome segregation ATPase
MNWNKFCLKSKNNNGYQSIQKSSPTNQHMRLGSYQADFNELKAELNLSRDIIQNNDRQLSSLKNEVKNPSKCIKSSKCSHRSCSIRDMIHSIEEAKKEILVLTGDYSTLLERFNHNEKEFSIKVSEYKKEIHDQVNIIATRNKHILTYEKKINNLTVNINLLETNSEKICKELTSSNNFVKYLVGSHTQSHKGMSSSQILTTIPENEAVPGGYIGEMGGFGSLSDIYSLYPPEINFPSILTKPSLL